MGGENQRYDDINSKENDGSVTGRHVQWVFTDKGNGAYSDSESFESTFGEDSSSLLSSSSSEIKVEEDDASSSSTSSSSSRSSSGPLYELSELMDQLPIKRGLSSYYQGKSQSFTSLASVKSVEDLAKKASPYRKRVKPCKKYSPKAIITKKSCSGSRVSSFVYSLGKNRGTFVGTTNSCRPFISVVHKHF